MQFFLLQRKTLVTISTHTTDRSHFLIFANTYEAALQVITGFLRPSKVFFCMVLQTQLVKAIMDTVCCYQYLEYDIANLQMDVCRIIAQPFIELYRNHQPWLTMMFWLCRDLGNNFKQWVRIIHLVLFLPNLMTLYQVRVITVFTVFRLLTDFVCLYNYEF